MEATPDGSEVRMLRQFFYFFCFQLFLFFFAFNLEAAPGGQLQI
jgi:hypothetical protein